MKEMRIRKKKKCTPGGVYLLHTMGWTEKEIAKSYDRPVQDIKLQLAIALMRPVGRRPRNDD